MKAKSIIKRITLYSSMVSLLFILNSSSVRKKDRNYVLSNIKVEKGKIEYRYGTIYIGDKEYLNQIELLNNNDVLVLDRRDDKDPNLKIFNSYRFDDYLIRDEIISCLLYYEELFPTKWNRSKNSLKREWLVHNMMHYIGYSRDRTTDVDLNNSDEKKYLIRKK